MFDLFKKEEVNKLYENLSQCKNDVALMDKIEEFLEDNILIKELDKRVLLAHHLITQENIYRVEDLSNLLNISPTTLRTLFSNKVGISPKDLIKIHRIKKALDYPMDTEESLTQLSYSLNYFDQAHFSNDFKDSIGLSSKQYFLNTELSADFSNFQRWRFDSLKEIIK